MSLRVIAVQAVLGDIDSAASLAGEIIPYQDRPSELLPSAGLVPLAPLLRGIALTVPCLLIPCRSAYQWFDGGDLWTKDFNDTVDV